MKTVSNPASHRWMYYWDVFLAIMAGIIIFLLLDVVSGGLLISVFIAGVALVIFGLIHYFFWGRALEYQVAPVSANRPVTAMAPQTTGNTPVDEIILILDEPERAELLRLVEQSLAAIPVNQADAQAKQKAALDGQLAEKLRMFGA